MKKYDILFCDLDGTLIETISGEVFPNCLLYTSDAADE